jgi:hypothetical protein
MVQSIHNELVNGNSMLLQEHNIMQLKVISIRKNGIRSELNRQGKNI